MHVPFCLTPPSGWERSRPHRDRVLQPLQSLHKHSNEASRTEILKGITVYRPKLQLPLLDVGQDIIVGNCMCSPDDETLPKAARNCKYSAINATMQQQIHHSVQKTGNTTDHLFNGRLRLPHRPYSRPQHALDITAKQPRKIYLRRHPRPAHPSSMNSHCDPWSWTSPSSITDAWQSNTETDAPLDHRHPQDPLRTCLHSDIAKNDIEASYCCIPNS